MTELNQMPSRILQALKITETLTGAVVLACVLDVTGAGSTILTPSIVIGSVTGFIVSRGLLTASAYVIIVEKQNHVQRIELLKIILTWGIIITACVGWYWYAMGDGYRSISLISTALVYLLYQFTRYEIDVPVENTSRLTISG
jgi:hypothetical protein